MRTDGFTLVEVMVALVLAGLSLSTAIGIFGVVTDTVRRLERHEHEDRRRENAKIWLSEALASAEVSLGTTDFRGTEIAVEFSGWQWSPDGWAEPARVRLEHHDAALWGTGSSGLRVRLTDSISGVRFAYLPTLGGESPWLQAWNSDETLPVALRVIVERSFGMIKPADTTIVLVGGGG